MPFEISRGYAINRDVRLAMRSGQRAVHVVWHTGDNGLVTYRRLRNTGTDVAAERILSSAMKLAIWSEIAAGPAQDGSDRDTVYVAWIQIDPNDFSKQKVMVRRSANDGASFSAAVSLTDFVRGVSPPLIRVAGPVAIVVWYQHEPDTVNELAVWVARSDDFGQTWAAATRIGCMSVRFDQFNTVSPTIDRPSELDVVLTPDGTTIVLAYPYRPEGGHVNMDGRSNVMVAISRNGGRRFFCHDATEENQPAPADTPWVLSCGRPRLALAGTRVHVAWQRGFPFGRICYRSLRMSDRAFFPPLSSPPAMHPASGVDMYALASSGKGPAGFTYRQPVGQGGAVVGGDGFLSDQLDPSTSGGPIGLKPLAAAEATGEKIWYAAALRWPVDAGMAIRSTTFSVVNGGIRQRSAAVHRLRGDETVKHVHVYVDPAEAKRVFVVWESLLPGMPTGSILLSTSSDGGGTFS